MLDFNSSDVDIKTAAEKAIDVYGRVDVLVNNAGTLAEGIGPVEELKFVSRHAVHFVILNIVFSAWKL